MKRFAKNVLSVILAALLCAALGTLFVACGEDEADPVPDQPVKVKDGIDFELACGTDREFAVADYITAYGNTVTAQSGDGQKVTATLEDGTLTIAAVSEGEATVTLTCGDVTVTFTVTVYRTYTVTVDGEPTQVRGGSEFTLPAAKQPADGNFEFVAWQVGSEQKQPGEKVTVTGDLTITSVTARKAPVKVKDGETFELAYNASRTFKVADYITAYGNTVTAQSNAAGVASAAVENGTLTITAVSEGETTVTLACVDVNVTFTVTVYRTYTVTVDGEPTQVRGGSEFTLPAAKQPADGNFEFVAWQVGSEQKQPGEKVTVTGDLTITSVTARKAPVKVKDGETFELAYNASRTFKVADYITAYGNTVTAQSNAAGVASAAVENGTLTITAVSEGEATVTLTCGEVNVTFTVTVTVGTPAFENGSISFDYFEAQSGSYTFAKTEPSGTSFTYEYAVETSGASVSGDTLTYTATGAVSDLVITVQVRATLAGTSVVKETSFTVTVNVTDSTPKAIENAIEIGGVVDLYAGDYVVDLAANIANAHNVLSYAVDGKPVEASEGKYLYTVEGAFGDAKQKVTFTVTATYGEDKAVTYTYTVWVIDSTAYRLAGGALEDKEGWTGMNGTFSENETYWEQYESNNDGFYYVGIDGGTETVQSGNFVVGGSGWITFKLGSMRPNEGKTLRNVYLEVVEYSEEGEGQVLAQVRNVLFADPAAALRLNDYKLDLSEYKGRTVFIRAVDNEDGGNFRSLYLDAFVTWYDEEPGDAYTDLTFARYLDTDAAIDLKDRNTVSVLPIVLSQGVAGVQYTFVGTVEGQGLTADGLNLTATASGVYTVRYAVQVNGETVAQFAVTVTVTNTTELPAFEDIEQTYAYADWQGQTVSVSLPQAEEQGRFTYAYAITAGEGAQIEGTALKYTPNAAGTLVFTVTVTLTDTNHTVTDLPAPTFTVTLNFADNDIALKDGDSITKAFDVNDSDIADKEQFTVNFADYILIPDGKNVTYTVTLDGKDGALELDENSRYTVVFADEGLSATPKTYLFRVTASSGTATLEYTVTLEIADTYQYRLYNGGFETGDLTGWTVTSGTVNASAVREETVFWNEEIPYNKVGQYHFDGWQANSDEPSGYSLRSETFTLGGSGRISFKMGGRTAVLKVYTADGTCIAEYANTKFLNDDALFPHVDAGSRLATMTTYVADLSDYLGQTLYIEICDEPGENWGVVFFDDIVTYYETVPVVFERYDVLQLNATTSSTGAPQEYHMPWETAVNQLANG